MKTKKANIMFVHFSILPFKMGHHYGHCSTSLEIVAGDQPNVSVSSVNLGLPPSIVLMTEDSENVTLCKAELFWNCSLVYIQCTG